MKRIYSFLSIGLAVVLSSCLKDISEEQNDNEVITTMEVHVKPTGGGAETVFKFEDPDGPGGAPATIDTIRLAPANTYSVEIVLLDKTKSPVTVVTDDVRAEDVDHRFYFETSASSNIVVSNLDTDINGIPLGIKSTWASGSASSGTMRIVLRHYENGGKSLNDPLESTKSSTDAEVIFNTKIQ